jgi:hypothetical protein
MMARKLLADDAVIPTPPGTAELFLEPLGEQHNESDLAAWSASIAHIKTTPGMANREWPPDKPYTLEQNLADMRMHATDFAARTGFTWTVLDPASREVIGCVYMYPPETATAVRDTSAPEGLVEIKSWVRADKARLDVELFRLVSDWLARDWPWPDVYYAPRPQALA